jgi:hypothetical protein
MPRVIDIQRRHMELGRIRMGEKGSKGQPQRLSTWRLTSASKELLDSAAAIYGGTVGEWTDAPDSGYYELTTETAVLDVMVPPGDAYSQYYELWSGGGCKRRCDGVTELLTDSPCKCDADERECKITTRINVMLPRVAGLGVWRLESHGYYAGAELPNQLDLLQQVSGGRLVAGALRIEQRSAKKDGTTKRFPVPVLDLPGITLASMLGGQVVVNAPASLEPGKPGLLTGTQLPDDPEFDNGSPGFGEKPPLPVFDAPEQGDEAEPVETPAAPVVEPAPAPANKRDVLIEVMKAKGLGIDALEEYATLLKIPKGQAATDAQLDLLIAAVRGHGTNEPLVIESGAAVESPPDSGQPASAVEPEAGVPAAPPAIPPKPNTTEYKALDAMDKANARAYWAEERAAERERPPMNPERETLGLSA